MSERDSYLQGIDVSHHQGLIEWGKVNKEIDFAILRAGYGKVEDRTFAENANACIEYGIPFGVYWFSYAMNNEQAIEEAKACLKVINKRKLALPVYYDFEYDSEKYNTVSNSALSQIYISFMSHIINYSDYRPGIYCDLNYYKRAGQTAFNRFPNASLWLAHWSEISFENHVQVYNCDVMQYRSDGTVNGIYTSVDMNYCKPGLLKNSADDGTALYPSDSIYGKIENRYVPVVDNIIAGKYGNGENRKAALQRDGYDYTIAQWFVNRKLS